MAKGGLALDDHLHTQHRPPGRRRRGVAEEGQKQQDAVGHCNDRRHSALEKNQLRQRRKVLLRACADNEEATKGSPKTPFWP